MDLLNHFRVSPAKARGHRRITRVPAALGGWFQPMGVQKWPFLSAGWRVSPGAAYYCLRSLCRGKGPAAQGKSMAAKVSPRVWRAESSANTCWYTAPLREWLLLRAFCRQALASEAAEMGSML